MMSRIGTLIREREVSVLANEVDLINLEIIYHIIRYIAETCKTTKEALGVFRKIPVAVPKNFLIADTASCAATT